MHVDVGGPPQGTLTKHFIHFAKLPPLSTRGYPVAHPTGAPAVESPTTYAGASGSKSAVGVASALHLAVQSPVCTLLNWKGLNHSHAISSYI